MKLNKADLQKALEIVKPGLANKEMIEHSTSFAFIGGRVVTYNDEISLSHPVAGLEIEGAVHAEELYKLLSKLKKDEIEIETEGGQILLKAGSRSKAGLTLQQDIKLPLEEIGEVGKWKTLPEDFTRLVRFAMGSCSRDMSKPVLTCVHVSKEGLIEGSDGFRITRCTMEEGMPVKDFLLPSSSAAELVRLQPTKIAEGKGWIHFQTAEGSIMSCRIFEDEFPDVSPFLEVEGIEVTFPRTIVEALDRASVFAKRDHFLDEHITVVIAENRIKLKSKSLTGWLEEEINMKFEDDPISFDITPYLLMGILSETLTCVISEDGLRFAGCGWVYVTTLKSNE